jgi:hypothetical protein
MDTINRLWRGKQVERTFSAPKDLGPATRELCEKALEDARAQLHPLLRGTDVSLLRNRVDFAQSFKRALENRIAQKLAAWQPGVLAVFQFDDSWMESRKHWDGSLHLLVKVPRLSKALKRLGKDLDKSLLKWLKQIGWSRFHKRQTVLEIQQVTPNELRHGIGYGAMFCAVHSRPVKVWPSKKA